MVHFHLAFSFQAKVLKIREIQFNTAFVQDKKFRTEKNGQSTQTQNLATFSQEFHS